MTRTAGRLLAVYLVGLVGLATLATSVGFVGVAAGAAGNTAPDCSTVSFSGSGTSSDPYEVGNVEQLQCIENQGLGNHYELTENIDASGTSQWNEQNSFTETYSTVFSPPKQIQLQHAPIDAGTVTVTDTHDDSDLSYTVVDAQAGTIEVTESSTMEIEVAYETQSPVPFGFEPIGDSNNPFTGEFNGDDHTISGLTIDRPNTDYLGLFGYVESGGTIRNVGLDGGSITGNDYVGGLTGASLGTVSESSVTVDMTGNSPVGGVVGYTEGTVERSYATGSVSGTRQVGGLVGRTFGISPKVSDSYAIGDVSGDSVIGGLVGLATDGTIERSYATGDVSGSSDVGGLVGRNADTLSESYWDKGTTNQGSAVGGAYGTTTGVQGFGSTGDTAPAPEMQGSSASTNMGNLDFTSTWETVVSGGDATADGYPILQSVDRQAQLGAQNVNAYAGGDGTASNPYEIANWYHLDNVSGNLDGNFTLVVDLNETTAGYDAVARETANSDKGFDPIGDSGTPFTGTFDGNGHTISGLSIDRGDDVGLFGETETGSSMTDVTLESPDVIGEHDVGPLVGASYGDITEGTVDGGDVTTDIGTDEEAHVGGLVGTIYDGTIERSTTSITIDADGNDEVGGLSGDMAGEGTVRESSATSDVTNGGEKIGGLLGDANADATITESFATGSLDGDGSIGGLVGREDGGSVDVSDSYWDTEATGEDETAGDGTGLTTDEMQGGRR